MKQNLTQGHLASIIGHLNGFSVARLTDELITSRLTTAIGITRNRIKHTRHARKILLNTPETATSKINHMII